MRWTLVFVAVMLCASAVRADLIIDDFAVNFGVKSNNGPATGASQSIVSGHSRIVGYGSQVTSTGTNTSLAMGNGNGRTAAVVYDLGSVKNLNVSSINNALKLSYSATAGDTYNIAFSILNSFSPTATVVASALLTAQPASGSAYAQNADFSDGGLALQNVRYLSVRVTRNANSPNPNTVFTFASLSAVPEPATVSLVGFSGLAAVIAHRRRRRRMLQQA